MGQWIHEWINLTNLMGVRKLRGYTCIFRLWEGKSPQTDTGPGRGRDPKPQPQRWETTILPNEPPRQPEVNPSETQTFTWLYLRIFKTY